MGLLGVLSRESSLADALPGKQLVASAGRTLGHLGGK